MPSTRTSQLKETALTGKIAFPDWQQEQQQGLVSISFVQPSGDQAPVIDIQADRL